MNVLILTPDRVGSTLLQRLITVYANINQTNNITVNLHELTNGIVTPLISVGTPVAVSIASNLLVLEIAYNLVPLTPRRFVDDATWVVLLKDVCKTPEKLYFCKLFVPWSLRT